MEGRRHGPAEGVAPQGSETAALHPYFQTRHTPRGRRNSCQYFRYPRRNIELQDCIRRMRGVVTMRVREFARQFRECFLIELEAVAAVPAWIAQADERMQRTLR